MTTRRKRRSSRRSAKAGLPPGTAVYTGTAVDVDVQAHVLDYDDDTLIDRPGAEWETIREVRDSATVSWVDIVGLHDVERLGTVAGHFRLHPLALEDLVAVDTRPKVEDHSDHLVVVLRMAVPDGDGVRLEHLGLVLGRGWVLSLQERPGDVFEPVRKRIRTSGGRIRRMGADYLLHALLDACVDGYFGAIEHFEDRVDAVEQEVLDGEHADLPHRAHRLKHEIAAFHRVLLPLRQRFAALERGDGGAVSEEVRPYFRDLSDHVSQALDLLDAARERASAVLELHLAATNNRMSDVMRLLTVVSTVFIPLTFIAGVYGMNFQHMPELSSPWGYPVVLVVMGALGAMMFWWMRRRLL